jgi:hypothetical protein
MSFRHTAFFNGFSRYLREERADTLRFLAVTASFEHWIQFEAGAWMDANRTAVGLNAETWSIALEQGKGDILLGNDQGFPNVSIEFKCIHNNKNCQGKVWDLRRDLSEAKRLPEGYSGENTMRFGLAVLIYLRYQRGREGGYQTLGGVVRDPWSADRFLDYVRAECGSTGTSDEVVPKASLLSEIEQVVSLEGGIGIDSACPGSAVWLALTTAEANPAHVAGSAPDAGTSSA